MQRTDLDIEFNNLPNVNKGMIDHHWGFSSSPAGSAPNNKHETVNRPVVTKMKKRLLPTLSTYMPTKEEDRA